MKTKHRGRAGNGGFRGYQSFPTMHPPAQPSVNQQNRSPFFEFVSAKDEFSGTVNTTDAVFEKEILDRAFNITATGPLKAKIVDFTAKVVDALEQERVESSVPEIKIVHIIKVGSFATDTALKTTNSADICVQLSTLPSFETVSALGNKVMENIVVKHPTEVSNMIPHDYGCCIMTQHAQVRIMITIVPELIKKLEPDLHLSEKVMMVNFFAVRHVKWFQSLLSSISVDFVIELKALIRVLKDVTRRYDGLKHLSVWTIMYLSYYCLSLGQNRQKINLGTAFRRFFELLATGVLTPKSPSIVDPTSMTCRIGWNLNFHQMDAVCSAAQTLVRIFATGSDGYRAIIGTHPATEGVDLTQVQTYWNNIIIEPPSNVYEDGCLDAYLVEKPMEE